MTDVGDCRCVACSGALWLRSAQPPDATEIVDGAIVCANCGASYDWVWGVPFIGHYERADFAGLVEIAANVDQQYVVSPKVVDAWDRALADYHHAADKEAFISTATADNISVIKNRYNEWLELVHWTDGEALAGRDVLDVGAGLGVDGYRHVRAGARVTALEFSPMLARTGRTSFPMMRWIGGFSHILPFRDQSFDFVFCNAALHHMRDIPGAIAEMLRVLRPGGYLVTTADPYRADRLGEEYELRIFDRHQDVLLGINERLPRFAEFVTAVESFRPHLRPQLATHMVYGALMPGGGRRDIAGLRTWDFDTDRAMLRDTSGSLSMKIGLDRAIGSTPRLQQSVPTLRPAQLARWLESQSEAMARLAAWAPDEAVNAPFPSERQDKLQLLNGWQAPRRWRRQRQAYRQAYRRARWYIRREPRHMAVTFDVRVPRAVTLSLLVNGREVERFKLAPAVWVTVGAPLTSTAPAVPFALEMRLVEEPATFDEGVFQVRRRRFRTAGPLRRIIEAIPSSRRLRQAAPGS